MAERHSSENGRHGGPGLPMFCGVIGAVGLAMATMTILMVGQASVGNMSASGGASGGGRTATSQAAAVERTAR